MTNDLKRRLMSFACAAGFFILWEVLCLILGVPDYVLPRPSQAA